MSFPANIRDHRLALLDLLKEAFQDSSKRSVMRTRGISMLPFLRERDEVVIRSVDFGSIRPGQIVAFRAGDSLVVHRAVSVSVGDTGPLLCEKGDNNMYMTQLQPSCVLGIVTEVGTSFRRIDLDTPWQRSIGMVVAWHGLLAVQLYSWIRAAGGRLFAPGSMASRWCRRAAVWGLQSPSWLLLKVARRLG